MMIEQLTLIATSRTSRVNAQLTGNYGGDCPELKGACPCSYPLRVYCAIVVCSFELEVAATHQVTHAGKPSCAKCNIARGS